MLTGKVALVTGGTGSFGKVLIRRLLTGEMGQIKKIIVFSRDETKQYEMRMAYQRHRSQNGNNGSGPVADDILAFHIGDVRDYHSVSAALRGVDVVFHAAAMKQVPTCEYFPYEAVLTNVTGPENIVRAIRDHHLPVQTVIGLSTDKAAKPVNVMGMTKALQERIFVTANIDAPKTRFVGVRYGNVLASRGSVIPLFHKQIGYGGPVTITVGEMTRFLLSLDQAVNTIFASLKHAQPGEIFVPRVPSARIIDIAQVLVGDSGIPIEEVGIRPGEKMHEIMVAEDEIYRTEQRGDYFAIMPMQMELQQPLSNEKTLDKEFNSADYVMSQAELADLLASNDLLYNGDTGNVYEYQKDWM